MQQSHAELPSSYKEPSHNQNTQWTRWLQEREVTQKSIDILALHGVTSVAIFRTMREVDFATMGLIPMGQERLIEDLWRTVTVPPAKLRLPHMQCETDQKQADDTGLPTSDLSVMSTDEQELYEHAMSAEEIAAGFLRNDGGGTRGAGGNHGQDGLERGIYDSSGGCKGKFDSSWWYQGDEWAQKQASPPAVHVLTYLATTIVSSVRGRWKLYWEGLKMSYVNTRTRQPASPRAHT